MDIRQLLETYGFRAMFSPELFIIMVILVTFYLRFLGNQVGFKSRLSFLSGLFAFISLLADRLICWVIFGLAAICCNSLFYI